MKNKKQLKFSFINPIQKQLKIMEQTTLKERRKKQTSITNDKIISIEKLEITNNKKTEIYNTILEHLQEQKTDLHNARLNVNLEIKLFQNQLLKIKT